MKTETDTKHRREIKTSQGGGWWKKLRPRTFTRYESSSIRKKVSHFLFCFAVCVSNISLIFFFFFHREKFCWYFVQKLQRGLEIKILSALLISSLVALNDAKNYSFHFQFSSQQSRVFFLQLRDSRVELFHLEIVGEKVGNDKLLKFLPGTTRTHNLLVENRTWILLYEANRRSMDRNDEMSL